MPGVISPATGLVKNANSTWLNGRPLAEDIWPRGSDAQVRLANDANCFALVRSDRRRRGRAARRLRRDRRHGRRRWIVVTHGRVVDRRQRDRQGSGGTTRCRGRRLTNSPGRPVIAAAPAASRPFSRDPGSRAISTRRAGRDCRCRQPRRRRRRPAIARPLAIRYRATSTGSRAASRRSSTFSIPTSIVLGGGVSNVARLYERVPGLWHAFVFRMRSSRAWSAPVTAIRAAFAAPHGCGSESV